MNMAERQPVLTSLKLALRSEMLAQVVRKAEMARRLNWHPPQVDRLLDLSHASQMDQMESAFRVLGKRVIFILDDE